MFRTAPSRKNTGYLHFTKGGAAYKDSGLATGLLPLGTKLAQPDNDRLSHKRAGGEDSSLGGSRRLWLYVHQGGKNCDGETAAIHKKNQKKQRKSRKSIKGGWEVNTVPANCAGRRHIWISYHLHHSRAKILGGARSKALPMLALGNVRRASIWIYPNESHCRKKGLREK